MLECVFVEKAWWVDFVVWHNLKAWEVMRFYRPVKSSQDYHYLVDFRRREIAGIPKLKQEHYLFQLKVTGAKYKRLLVPTEKVRDHFHVLGIPAGTHGIERLYFTDDTCSNWSIDVMCYGSRDPQYMLVPGDAFVDTYGLTDGEFIRFYRPDNPWSLRHFDFEFGLTGESGPDSFSPETAGGDGSEDDGGPNGGSSGRGGGNVGGNNSGGGNEDGDGAGKSHSGGQKRRQPTLLTGARKMGRPTVERSIKKMSENRDIEGMEIFSAEVQQEEEMSEESSEERSEEMSEEMSEERSEEMSEEISEEEEAIEQIGENASPAASSMELSSDDAQGSSNKTFGVSRDDKQGHDETDSSDAISQFGVEVQQEEEMSEESSEERSEEMSEEISEERSEEMSEDISEEEEAIEKIGENASSAGSMESASDDAQGSTNKTYGVSRDDKQGHDETDSTDAISQFGVEVQQEEEMSEESSEGRSEEMSVERSEVMSEEKEAIEKPGENASFAAGSTELASDGAQGSSNKTFGVSRDDKQGHDETNSEAISHFGEPSYRADQEELQVSATNPTSPKMENFLFEVYLTPGDIERDRLFIPVEQALDHFPPLANRQQTYGEITKLSHGHDQMFSKIEYDILECVFVVNKWWKALVVGLNLKAWDRMRFFRPGQPFEENHYLLVFLKRDEEEIAGFPEFKPQNFLFQLTVTGIMYNRLLVSTEKVRSHFPAIGIPAETHGIERLYLTDGVGHNWSIDVMSYGSRDPQYMVVIEDAFVNRYKLVDGKVIRFYKPDNAWSSRHFLIGFGEKGEVEIDSSPIGIAGSHGTEDDGGPNGGNTGRGGGTGGDSTSGGGKVK